METFQYSLDDIRDIIIRRKWILFPPILICLLVSLILCFVIPKIYRAETLILVVPQKIPENYIKPIVAVEMRDRLITLRQEIFSRTRLERIIDEFNLYSDLRAKEPLENIVETMRDSIELEVKGKDSFKVYYSGRDPKTVMNVTNKLAGLFIEENIKQRATQARGTTDFLSVELNKIEIILKEQESKIANFKAKYMGSLPEQRDVNLSIINQLINEGETISASLRDAKNRKILLQEQLSGTRSSVRIVTNQGEGGTNVSQGRTEYANPQQRLADLKSRYTDDHPEVKRLKKKIESMGTGALPTDQEQASINPLYREISTQLKSVSLEIQKLEEEQISNKTKLAEYKDRVALSPKLEQEQTELTRDYQNNKRIYEDLLKKKMDAEQAENLEQMRKGEQFEVLDPARMPEVSYKPNKKLLLAVGLLLGLALGLVVTFVKEYLNKSFYTTKEVESFLELPVLASIPKWDHAESLK